MPYERLDSAAEVGLYRIGKNPPMIVRALHPRRIATKRCDVSPCGEPGKYEWSNDGPKPGDWIVICPAGEACFYSDAAFRRSTGAHT